MGLRRFAGIPVVVVVAAIMALPVSCAAHARAAQDAPPAPKILLDLPLRAVEYQLGRLTNDEIVRLERTDTDARYRPVYFALLTRQGLPKTIRDEALVALTKMGRTSQAQVLLEALVKVRVEDAQIGDRLVALLFSEPADALRVQRAAFSRTIEQSNAPLVLRGAYGALMIGDGNSEAALQMAAARPGHRPPALLALAAARVDVETFRLLAEEVVNGSDGPARAAAVSALHQLPDRVWPPAAELEPLAVALVNVAKLAPRDARTESPIADAMQLAEKLAAALPEELRAAVRRDVRALGVRVIRIAALPEQMAFDLRWFAVEAGTALQIVLNNPDAMPHNLIVGAPKSVEAIGIAAMAMGMPSDPSAKPFVPDSPLVLQATALLKEGESYRLSFTTPKEPGEYVFLCSYPGHWVRMYGVMLVVENLEAWEASPTTPIDPMTNRPFASER